MEDLFLILMFVALILFFASLFKPRLNFWAKNNSRKHSFFYLALVLIFFILVGVTAPPSSQSEKAANTHTKADTVIHKSENHPNTNEISDTKKEVPSKTAKKDDSKSSDSTDVAKGSSPKTTSSTDSNTTASKTSATPTVVKKPTIRNDLLAATVSKNVDGDTIHVTLNGHDETIRMLLIDTPEDVDPRKPVEPYALDAAHYAASKLPIGKHIYIKEGIEKRDKYQRLLAYVYITPKDMYNVDVVKAGLARVGYIYNDKTYLSQLTAAQSSAKSAHKAIWSIPNYVDNANDRYNMQIACSWASSHHESTRGCTAYQPSKPKTTTTTKSISSSTNHSSSSTASSKTSKTKSTTSSSPSSSGHKAGCNIKGSSSHIYHLPGDAYYNRTTHVVQWFCSEKDAQNAGYRASKR